MFDISLNNDAIIITIINKQNGKYYLIVYYQKLKYFISVCRQDLTVSHYNTFLRILDCIFVIPESVDEIQKANCKNSLEKIIEQELIRNNFQDLSKHLDLNIDIKNKKRIFLDFKNINFNNKQNYFCKKLSLKNDDNKIVELDMLIFFKNTFYMFEIKSSPQIDSKKAEQETNSLFEATKILQKNILKHKSFPENLFWQ